MPLGQGFLNSWLKVNSKHVVIPNKNDREGKAEGPRQASRSIARKSSVGSPKTANTIKSIEEESSQVVRRRSIRKNKRRLQRTVSASDLIRNKISGKGSKRFTKSEDVLEISGSGRSSSAGTLDSSKRSTRKEQHDEYQVVESSSQTATKALLHDDEEKSSSATENNGSLRFVAGFFGADIELNAGTIDRDLENKSARSGPHVANNDSFSESSRGGKSLPARIKSRPLGGSMGLRFPPNIFALDSVPPERSREFAQLEAELTSAREDLEYLREISLRNEYSYSSGGPHVQQSTVSSDNRLESIHGSSSLEDSEQERGIEDMKREWAVIQDELQQEIQKYAELCIKLNEEAENRNEEALNLHSELNFVSCQRNKLATEVEVLRARIEEYKKEERGRRNAELLLQKYEENGLDHISREIGTRDAIIEDLSDRLERTLESLSMEREKQNKRRQIIFPNHQHSNQGSAGRETAMEQELRATRDALQRAEQTIELLRLDRG